MSDHRSDLSSEQMGETPWKSPPVFPNPHYPGIVPGLTKRELFAAMALQGILANPHLQKSVDESNLPNELVSGVFAKTATDSADALIKALEEKK